jgi:molybdenum-dependent DNA-binding transcriptional regulator ModE
MQRGTLDDLASFVAVARERSFTKAAKKLGVSQSALSHMMRELEARLGVRLLTRTTRSVSPTEAGERLLHSLGSRFEEIEAEVAAVRELREKPAGTVRITATENATETILVPRLAPLLRQYRLTVGNVYQNFTRFEEVTRVLSRLRGWHVADKGALKKDEVYQAGIRMRLDTAQLPKPFQLNAIASRDWNLASDWHRWTIVP